MSNTIRRTRVKTDGLWLHITDSFNDRVSVRAFFVCAVRIWGDVVELTVIGANKPVAIACDLSSEAKLLANDIMQAINEGGDDESR